MAVQVKENRIDLRIDTLNKQLLEKAASVNNLSLTSYIISVCIKQAKIDIQENEVLMLGDKDRDFVLGLLMNDEEPNQALKDLFK